MCACAWVRAFVCMHACFEHCMCVGEARMGERERECVSETKIIFYIFILNVACLKIFYFFSYLFYL